MKVAQPAPRVCPRKHRLAGATNEPSPSRMPHILEVRDLCTSFASVAGVARAVDGVTFHIAAGEMLALVGESGCGKSAIALSVMRLLPPNGRIDRGAAIFEGRDLLTLDARALRDLRGRRISLIFQEPA